MVKVMSLLIKAGSGQGFQFNWSQSLDKNGDMVRQMYAYAKSGLSKKNSKRVLIN